MARESGWWPTANQTLLLHAALDMPAVALTAWQEWRSRVHIETEFIDTESFRLLPLAWHNLKSVLGDDPIVQRLKGLTRYTWAHNQYIFARAAGVIRILESAGIATLVLKGGALTLGYYHSHGLRHAADVDVLVPLDKREQALTLLTDAGWALPDGFARSRLPLIQAIALLKDESPVDLHWHVLPETVGSALDHRFWEAAIPLTIAGVQTRTLNPTDQLVHMLAHGAVWHEAPPARWVADALWILRSGAALDWERFIELAAALTLNLTLAHMLIYLTTEFDAVLPPGVTERLLDTAHSRYERLEYAIRSRRRNAGRALIAVQLFRYWRYRKAGGAISLPEYLRRWWGLGSVWSVPLFGVRRATGRLLPARGTKV